MRLTASVTLALVSAIVLLFALGEAAIINPLARNLRRDLASA